MLFICLFVLSPRELVASIQSCLPLSQEEINTSNHNTEEEDKDERPDDNFGNI